MRILGIAPLLVLFTLLAISASGQNARDPMASVRESLQRELEDVSQWEANPNATTVLGPAGVEYLHRLESISGQPAGSLRVRLGKLPLVRPGKPTTDLGVVVYQPEGQPRGTLLFVHGYLSHSANFAFTCASFVRRGWTVVTLDLPGHGLSSGPRGDVDSFADYGDAVVVWLKWAWKSFPTGEKVLLAHSLGTAGCLEALRRPGTPVAQRIVFCAPLLRPDWYPALSLGQFALGWAVRDFPSSFGWDGYLDGYTMPLHWFEALGRWLEEIDAQGPLSLPLTVYSGDRDDVVDENWNRAEYRRLVPQHTWINLPGKGHLFLTNKDDRQEFQEKLQDELGL